MMKATMRVLVCVVALSGAGCATVGQLSVQAQKLVHESIEQSELNRCSVHVAPCLSDDQFRRVNLDLYKATVVGENFATLSAQGQPTIQNVADYLSGLGTALADLHAAFPYGLPGLIVQKLSDAQGKVNTILKRIEGIQ